MLGGIFNHINSKRPKNPELVRAFWDAVYFIDKFFKEKKVDEAIFATRELILKHKTWVSYYEEVIRKLHTLEAVNISSISKRAKSKINQVRRFLNVIYRRITILDKRLKHFEKFQEKIKLEKKTKSEQEIIKNLTKDINFHIWKKEFEQALQLAKKLVNSHIRNIDSLRLLGKCQELLDKETIKNTNKKWTKEDILKKVLNEHGIDADKLLSQVIKDNILLSILTFFKVLFIRYKASLLNRWRMNNLSNLDAILKKSWWINWLSDISASQLDLFGSMNAGLTKELEDFHMNWFDVYWRIIWKDKIVWDTFWHIDFPQNSKTVFYFWDATWHWVQAWFTVAVMSKIFFEHKNSYKVFSEFFLKINNLLKEKIKWKVFITWIFFEWDYWKNILNIIWAWHIPMFLFRKKTGTIEKIIPWWLAMWVRNIANVSSIKVKDLTFEDWDVLFWYTDWMLEVRNTSWEMYWLSRLDQAFAKWVKIFSNPEKIYEYLIADINAFKWEAEFDDDVSFFIFTRNSRKDILSSKAELADLIKDSWIKKAVSISKYKWKTKIEIEELLKKEKHEHELSIRLSRLSRLVKMWEYIKLKQEIIIYYKEWYVHPKMWTYLEKAIEYENKFNRKKIEERLERKYTSLNDLLKKGEFELVMKETLDVIYKNWKI